MVSNTYLTYREERPRIQWNLKLASLKKMIKDAQTDESTRDEDLEILLQRCDEMEALFRKDRHRSPKDWTRPRERKRS